MRKHLTSAISDNRLYLHLMLLLCCHLAASSQNQEPELIYVHIDKPFYVAGESIRYKVYFLNDPPVVSELVHLELLDGEGLIKEEQILKISGNSATGTIKLPLSMQEAMYTIRCYTLWNLNFGNEYVFFKDIPVYDAWKESSPPQDEDLDSQKNTKPYKVQISGDMDIFLINEDKIHPNDLVSIHLSLKGKGPANLSVSVYDLNLLRPEKQTICTEIKNFKTEPLISEFERIHEPERSLRVYGRLIDPDTKEGLRSNVLSVYDPSEMTFTRMKSKDGSFSFELSPFTGKRKIQIINMNPFQAQVPDVAISRLGSMASPGNSLRDFPERGDEILRYLHYSRLRSKIREIFQDDLLDSLKSLPVARLGFEADRTYDMSEYRLIKNVEEFIHEAVINSSTFKKDGQKKLKLFNAETKKFFMREPWMMVDGYFIFNDSLVYNIPFSNVSQIDIFSTNSSLMKYFDPIMIQGGVIAVFTTNNYLGDYIEQLPNLVTVSGVYSDPVVDSSGALQMIGDRVPDLEPLIYWNPSVMTDAEGKADVAFRMNDITGDCLFVVEGIGRGRKYITGELMFQVFP